MVGNRWRLGPSSDTRKTLEGFNIRREITIKQALATAGLDPAQPVTINLIRRSGKTEEHYTYKSEELFSGTRPEMFLQPNDLLNIQK